MPNQHAQHESDVARLRASLAKTYADIDNDEARAIFLEGIAQQIQGVDADGVAAWLATAPQAPVSPPRIKKRPTIRPALIHRRRRLLNRRPQ